MSSIFDGGRYVPFSLDGWDPLGDFHFIGNLAATVPHAVFPDETTSFVSVRMDWKETPEAHVMKAELPGLKKNEVKVKVEGAKRRREGGTGVGHGPPK
jgi:HSP20 family protein